MMKKRIGNDIQFTWHIFRKSGETQTPESFDGKDVEVKLISPLQRPVTIEDVSIATGVVTFTFKGKYQTTLGNYVAVLQENKGENGMATLDVVNAVTLVPHSYMEEDGDDGDVIETETVELTSTISAGGGGGFVQQQADWTQMDDTAVNFILHKPDVVSVGEDGITINKQFLSLLREAEGKIQRVVLNTPEQGNAYVAVIDNLHNLGVQIYPWCIQFHNGANYALVGMLKPHEASYRARLEYNGHELAFLNELAAVALSGSYNDLKNQPTLDDLNKDSNLYSLDNSNGDYTTAVEELLTQGTAIPISHDIEGVKLRVYTKPYSGTERESTSINLIHPSENKINFSDGVTFTAYQSGNDYYIGLKWNFFDNTIQSYVNGIIEVTCEVAGVLKLYFSDCNMSENAYFKKNGQTTDVKLDNGVLSFDVEAGDVLTVSPNYTDYQWVGLVGMSITGRYPVSKFANDIGYITEDAVNILLAGKQDTITDLPAIRSGAAAGATAVQPADLTPIDNRLDGVEYCLGDYLKETYVFNALNKPEVSTEPVYTTRALYTVVQGDGHLYNCKCRLSAGGQQIDALYLGFLDSSNKIYFTKSGKATIYLVLNAKPLLRPADFIASIYDNNDNVVRPIRVDALSYNPSRICTPITCDVAAGYYLKLNLGDPGNYSLWLGQIDFEITGPVKQISTDVHANSNAITAIEQKIPAQASSSNQLADKDFVNSSIATATATYRGSYNLVSDLLLSVSATQQQIATALATKMEALSITPDNNDYCFVQIPTADATPTEIARIDRYKYDGTAWAYEYSLNNSSFTAAQWAALNSGITSGLVAKLSDLPTATELAKLLAGKASTQELAGKEDKMPIVQVASGTTAINAAVNTYYEVAGDVGALAITLPTPTDLTKVSMVVVHLTAGTTPNVVIGSTETIDYSAAYDISASKEYEINCMYNGDKWIVAGMEVV